MANQILPITEMEQIGLVMDTPPMAIAPNAFSNCRNVRFKNGAITKMEGEVNIFPNLFDDPNTLVNGVPLNFDGSILKYIVWWDNPNISSENKGYYLVIVEEERLEVDDSIPPQGNTDPTHQKDIAYLVSIDGTIKSQKGVYEPVEANKWQHTFFQGGYALIINNGINIPNYILDIHDNKDINLVDDFAELPGWDNYILDLTVYNGPFLGETYAYNLGRWIDFTTCHIEVRRVTAGVTYEMTAKGDTGAPGTPNNIGYVAPDLSTLTTTPWTVSDEFEIYYNSETNTHVVNLPNNLTTSDEIIVSKVSHEPVHVSCEVIRSFGDFLVAGALKERSSLDYNSTVIRTLNGIVRTSDAASPGFVPNNWDPYAAGVSTADEFAIADTGVVRDMVEMQGSLYLYTNDSISVMRLTGNTSVPLSVTPVTDSYGCNSIGCVLEFDGKHFVVGSQDIYVFGGHPGSIQSIAEGRVRKHFLEDLNPLRKENMFCLRHEQKDEIWICYPSVNSNDGTCDDALIYNYRNNTWTQRTLRGVIGGDVAPIPGGGIPSLEVTFSNDSGNTGVINIGAYEVRTLGIDPSTEIIVEKLFYYANPTGLMYKTGRDGDVARKLPNGTYQMYQIYFYPIVNITGPEDIDINVQLYNPNPTGSDISSDQIIEMLVEGIQDQTGNWQKDSLPSGYTQLTDHTRLISTSDDFDISGRRKVDANTPFVATIVSRGNTLNHSTLSIDLQDSINTASVYGVVKADTNDYRGEHIIRSTGTVVAILLNSVEHPGGQELVIIEIGEPGDYDPDTHVGTNGIVLSSTESAEYLASRLQYLSNSLDIVYDNGNSVSLSPASYSAAANFIIDFRINDTVENAAWIYDKYQQAINGEIDISGDGDPLYLQPVTYNTVSTTLKLQSIAPTPEGSLDDQLNPDPLRVPGRVSQSTEINMAIDLVAEEVFDIFRPWSTDEINPNIKVPIFASLGYATENNLRYSMYKIIATDIGWSVPSYSYQPRTTEVPEGEFRYTITGNDAPIPYESFVERKQLNIAPDFDTETIKEIIMWTSGNTIPYVNSDYNYNRLQVRMIGTDNPGQSTNLSTIGDKTVSNTFFISEDYKLGMRVHGRFINFRITDNILDDNNVYQATEVNPKNSKGVVYTQEALWEVSGMQSEVTKGGRR